MNRIQTWAQGRFIDQRRYGKMSDDWKAEREREEALLVRPAPFGNPICKTEDPEHAKWIAQRLNLASKLERMSYDYATGKTDGSEIVDFIKSNVQ